MSTKVTNQKASYTQHSAEYKQEALISSWQRKLVLPRRQSNWGYMNPSFMRGANSPNRSRRSVMENSF